MVLIGLLPIYHSLARYLICVSQKKKRNTVEKPLVAQLKAVNINGMKDF